MMERIMQARRPQLSPRGAAALLGELFGVVADDARDLGSERDQAFLVLSGGRPVSVLEVSNRAEDPEVLHPLLEHQYTLIDHETQSHAMRKVVIRLRGAGLF